MTLKNRIQEDMKSAMKAGDRARVGVLRMLMAAIKQQEVDTRSDTDDDAVISILTRMVKQRRDSVAQFRDGNRDDLAQAEEAEIVVLESYLPEQMADEEIDALVDRAIDETGAKSMRDMGAVMARLRPQVAGRADLGAVSGRVKARLS